MKNMVKNVPEYAWSDSNPYWLVTEVDGDMWFYGAYDDPEQAMTIAMREGKRLIEE